MFKVLCIDDRDSFVGGWECEQPKIGNEYIVEFECIGYTKFKEPIFCYKILGFDKYVFERKNFIRVSEIDETEFIREQLTEKV